MTPAKEQKLEHSYSLPELYRTYKPTIYSFILSSVYNPDLAEDLTQETFLRATRYFSRFDGAHPSAWLHKIARSVTINRWRRDKMRIEREHQLVRDHPDSWITGTDPHDLEYTCAAAQTDGLVTKLLNDLPEGFATTFRLIVLENFSYQEAADITGVPIGTVMSRLYRARRLLRNRLCAPVFSDEKSVPDITMHDGNGAAELLRKKVFAYYKEHDLL